MYHCQSIFKSIFVENKKMVPTLFIRLHDLIEWVLRN
jgi:hypothetical protein